MVDQQPSTVLLAKAVASRFSFMVTSSYFRVFVAVPIIPYPVSMGWIPQFKFRQAVYDHGLTRARDAQFELLDALLLSLPIRSFPELSLSPLFRRRWPSAYATIEQGEQDQE